MSQWLKTLPPVVTYVCVVVSLFLGLWRSLARLHAFHHETDGCPICLVSAARCGRSSGRSLWKIFHQDFDTGCIHNLSTSLTFLACYIFRILKDFVEDLPQILLCLAHAHLRRYVCQCDDFYSSESDFPLPCLQILANPSDTLTFACILAGSYTMRGAMKLKIPLRTHLMVADALTNRFPALQLRRDARPGHETPSLRQSALVCQVPSLRSSDVYYFLS